MRNILVKKLFSILVLLTISLTFANAKYTKLTNNELSKIANSDTRFVHSLSGKWDYSLDNEKTWLSIDLPCNFSDVDKVVMKKTIKINKDLLNKNAWQLQMLGVNDEVEIYINSIFIGKYSGYGTPININIPKRSLIGQSNNIKLIFHSPTGKNRLVRNLAFNTKRNDIGPFREIILVGTNNLWIKNVLPKTTYKNDLTAPRIDFDIFVSSEKVNEIIASSINNNDTNNVQNFHNQEIIEGLKIIAKIIDKESKDTVRTIRSNSISIKSQRTEKLHLAANLNNMKLWSPDNPNLYTIKLLLLKDGNIIDEYYFDYGFYKFDAYKDKLTLNNKQFVLKGLTYYEDYYHTSNITDAQRLRKDIKLIKLLGANTIFAKGNIINPVMVSVCDSLGLFILNELPVFNIPNNMLALEEIQVITKNILIQSANYYQHFPSILGYGILNSCTENTENSNNFSNNIINEIKNISDKKIFKTVNIDENEINTDNYDFILITNLLTETNFYNINNKINKIKTDNNNIPLIFIYGAVCNPLNHNGYSDPLSIDFQAYNISNCYKIAEANNFAGNIINSFNDYLLGSPLLTTNYSKRDLGSYGIFSRARKFRISLKTVQALFNNETEPLLNAGSYNEKAPVSFLIITLLLLAILFVMLGRIKRFREYFLRSLSRPYNFYADIRDQRIISYSHTIILAITIAFTLAIYIVSMLYINRHNEIVEFILSFFMEGQLLKESLFNMIWQPNIMILSIGLFIIVSFVIVAFIIKLTAFLLKVRIYFTDSLTIAVWSANPIIILAFLNIINMRLLIAYPFSAVIFSILLLFFIAWTYLRILRSLSVVFDKSVVNIYIVGVIIAFAITSIPILYYYYEYNFMSYFNYIIGLI